MHIEYNKGSKSDSLKLCNLLSHQLHSVQELRVQRGKEFLNSVHTSL
jgi:hypothetical protein